MTTDPFRSVRNPETRERLMDREQVADAYANYTINAGAKSLGCGRIAFTVALRMHGIAIRPKGTPPPGTTITRDAVKAAAARAYARVGRCPPNCPGAMYCLNEGAECIG